MKLLRRCFIINLSLKVGFNEPNKSFTATKVAVAMKVQQLLMINLENYWLTSRHRTETEQQQSVIVPSVTRGAAVRHSVTYHVSAMVSPCPGGELCSDTRLLLLSRVSILAPSGQLGDWRRQAAVLTNQRPRPLLQSTRIEEESLSGESCLSPAGSCGQLACKASSEWLLELRWSYVRWFQWLKCSKREQYFGPPHWILIVEHVCDTPFRMPMTW